jgi:ubiquinone/menaquinone biosynthesis C-methylase UbiE
MNDLTAIRNLVQRARPIGPSDRILDLACGTGAVARILRERLGGAANVTGLDAHPHLLAKARAAAPDVEWVDGQPAALPFADGSFELILCHQLPQGSRDLGPILCEARRVLSAGGRFIGATSQDGDAARAGLLEADFIDVRVEPGTAEGAVVCARKA